MRNKKSGSMLCFIFETVLISFYRKKVALEDEFHFKIFTRKLKEYAVKIDIMIMTL